MEIDIKNEVDLEDGFYLAKEISGQDCFALITHSHGNFDGDDIASVKCNNGFPVVNMPAQYSTGKVALQSTDFVFTKCIDDVPMPQ